MAKLKFEMKPFDFGNVKNVIGPFNLNDKIENEMYFEVIEQIEFSPFGIGSEYETMMENENEFIVINDRIPYELDSIIRDILGQEDEA